MVEPVKEQKPVPMPTPTPPPPKPPSVPAKPHVAKQTHKALLISGAIVLLALAIGGYLLIRSVQQPQPEPTPGPAPQPPVAQPSPIPEPEPVVPEPEPEPVVQEVLPGKDSDSDGLTDLEENLLYKTNPNLPDTDVDGFLDGNEVFHRYNPGGTAPGTLLDAGAVRLYDRLGIQMAYPAPWTTISLSEFSDSFESTTGEVITLTKIGPAPNAETAASAVTGWIERQGGQEQIVKTVSKSGFDLYITQDKRQALILINGISLEFVYELGNKQTVDYLQTFQMMLNSIETVPGV